MFLSCFSFFEYLNSPFRELDYGPPPTPFYTPPLFLILASARCRALIFYCSELSALNYPPRFTPPFAAYMFAHSHNTFFWALWSLSRTNLLSKNDLVTTSFSPARKIHAWALNGRTYLIVILSLSIHPGYLLSGLLYFFCFYTFLS